MVRKFPGKGPRKSGNCWISEKRTISAENSENQIERKFPGKYVWKFGYTSRGRKLCKFAIYYSALVLLAAITASWTSHARMTVTRIRKLKFFRIFSLICREILATVKFVKKAIDKNNAPVVKLFVLHRLARKCTKIYNACRTIVRLIKVAEHSFARAFADAIQRALKDCKKQTCRQ